MPEDRVCHAHGRKHTHCGVCEGYHQTADCTVYRLTQLGRALSWLIEEYSEACGLDPVAFKSMVKENFDLEKANF